MSNIIQSCELSRCWWKRALVWGRHRLSTPPMALGQCLPRPLCQGCLQWRRPRHPLTVTRKCQVSYDWLIHFGRSPLEILSGYQREHHSSGYVSFPSCLYSIVSVTMYSRPVPYRHRHRSHKSKHKHHNPQWAPHCSLYLRRRMTWTHLNWM